MHISRTFVLVLILRPITTGIGRVANPKSVKTLMTRKSDLILNYLCSRLTSIEHADASEYLLVVAFCCRRVFHHQIPCCIDG